MLPFGAVLCDDDVEAEVPLFFFPYVYMRVRVTLRRACVFTYDARVEWTTEKKVKRKEKKKRDEKEMNRWVLQGKHDPPFHVARTKQRVLDLLYRETEIPGTSRVLRIVPFTEKVPVSTVMVGDSTASPPLPFPPADDKRGVAHTCHTATNTHTHTHPKKKKKQLCYPLLHLFLFFFFRYLFATFAAVFSRLWRHASR